MKSLKFVIGGFLAFLLIVWFIRIQYWTKEKVDFNTQIRPILNQHCLRCHGGVKQQGGLSFLFPEEAFLPAESGKYAIVPGEPDKSELITRVLHENKEIRMPPEGNPLSTDEVQLLRQWIREGAEWDDHWAYLPSQKQEIPGCSSDWCKNEIDHFVFQKLQSKGLNPSPGSNKEVLIRRLSLDLIGLPPNPELVERFLQDDRPQAYEVLVDTLLSSPHFGERWASLWLDLARYADSKGYQKDRLRKNIWRYRDWVIHAFNQDMPFDQFTIEQLAGDLLPNPSPSQILATAFHRNTMTNDEGGTDDEEFRVAAVIDRVNTTMEVWQASTISCVQCHSHPYDPIRHKEFYGLYAFFNNTMDADLGNDFPRKTLLSPHQQHEKESLKHKLASFQKDTTSLEYQNLLQKFLNVEPGLVPVMSELSADSSRKTHIFERGNWLVHGDEVMPDVPGCLPKLSKNLPKNRLGFAQWLVDPDQPLTSRVMVNRLWEQLFGNGLVKTLSDLGTQGDLPTHPELLDWLAYEFSHEYQWSMKSLLKTIVMSATYRQRSDVSEALLELDPYNEWLARGPRFRLSAEQIRDQALAISGLLNPKIYGPSVMPYQPEGVWNVIRHTARWIKSGQGDQHRRGIYTFWRRVSPYPSMISFDSPSREICTSQRIRTNTPLQALVTLNDPVFMEAATALAKKMMIEGGDNSADQIRYGFKLALMREPEPPRLNKLLEFYEKAIKEYQQTEKIGKSQQLAAMENVANVILNLNEVITKT